MEDLNNPVVTAQAFSKLLKNIEEKHKNESVEIPEIEHLYKKSLSQDNAINIVACDTILHLVENGTLSAKSVLVDFMAILTTTKSSSNTSYLINNLLLVELQNELRKNANYKSPYNLRMPQHPLITLLNENINSWMGIYNEIVYSYRMDEANMVLNYHDLYKPLFLYVICDPMNANLNPFRRKLWSFILEIEDPNNTVILNHLLSWMQFDNSESILMNSDFLIELSECNLSNNVINANLMFLWQTSILHLLISNNYNPRLVILNLLDILETHDIELFILNPVLILLSKSIPVCPSSYLTDLLRVCKMLIERGTIHPIILNTIKSTLLHWIANSSLLVSEGISLANELVVLIEENLNNEIEIEKNHSELLKKISKTINTNNFVDISIELCITLDSWTNEEEVIIWLTNLEQCPNYFLNKIALFLCGLLITKFSNTNIACKILELILRCTDYNRKLSSNVLTLLLYKLTTTNDPKMQFQLLKALPKMATMKENIPKIIGTIQALSHGPPTLKTFAITLMFDLWKLENKCYSHLETMLINKFEQTSGSWQYYITKAHTLKELCNLKPELYGKELVAHLSKILNDCNNPDGALACSLAIEGITLLCKHEVIDAVTTLATLKPMIEHDNRVPVIKSLCALMHEIPKLPYAEAYPQISKDSIANLWKYATLNMEEEVTEAAFNALTSFNIEEILAQMPDEYLDEDSLNLKEAGQLLSSNCCISFLKQNQLSSVQLAVNFLIRMVSLEVSAYLKFVYQVKEHREPVNFNYLPNTSVVRAIASYLKRKVTSWKGSLHEEVYLECLRIFSEEYSKPLPPLDWCFLQELIHEEKSKHFAISIAAHQVVLSGSARRLIVNYIEAIAKNKQDNGVVYIYKNLKHLANSIQPFTLKPFLEVTIKNAVDSFGDGNEEQLVTIINHIKYTLKDQSVQEANKLVIGEILKPIINETNVSSRLFEVLLDCIILLPTDCIKEISLDEDSYKKTVQIRCNMALNADKSPFIWLKALDEIGVSTPMARSFIFKNYAVVFKKHINSPDCVMWMLDLIGQIQAAITNRHEKENLLFLSNTFILAVIIFSGHFVLMSDATDHEEMHKIFPQAIATLLDVNQWSVCTNQALEWFHHMTTDDIVPQEYRDMFKHCLQSLRHEHDFKKHMKWIKYLNIEC